MFIKFHEVSQGRWGLSRDTVKDALWWQVGDIPTEPELAFSVRWSLPEAPQVDRGGQAERQGGNRDQCFGYGLSGWREQESMCLTPLRGKGSKPKPEKFFSPGVLRL